MMLSAKSKKSPQAPATRIKLRPLISRMRSVSGISGSRSSPRSFLTRTSRITCAAGIALFTLTLIVQRYLGSKDAKDILNELLGKVLRKLHLAR